jgi:hypothetical protein
MPNTQGYQCIMAHRSLCFFRKVIIECISSILVFLKLKWILGVSAAAGSCMGGDSCTIWGIMYDVATNSRACGICCHWFNFTVDGTNRQGRLAGFFSTSFINISTNASFFFLSSFNVRKTVEMVHTIISCFVIFIASLFYAASFLDFTNSLIHQSSFLLLVPSAHRNNLNLVSA